MMIVWKLMVPLANRGGGVVKTASSMYSLVCGLLIFQKGTRPIRGL